MRILLDTHALLWALSEPALLGIEARAALASRRNDIMFSLVSVWELMIKTRTGKLRLDHRDILMGAQTSGFVRVGVEPNHLDALARLPKHHGDPFDHLLLAQAIAEEAAFMSSDRMATHYPVELIAAKEGPARN